MTLEEFLCDFSNDEHGRATPRYALLDDVTRAIVASAWNEADTLARQDCADICESQASCEGIGQECARMIRATIKAKQEAERRVKA